MSRFRHRSNAIVCFSSIDNLTTAGVPSAPLIQLIRAQVTSKIGIHRSWIVDVLIYIIFLYSIRWVFNLEISKYFLYMSVTRPIYHTAITAITCRSEARQILSTPCHLPSSSGVFPMLSPPLGGLSLVVAIHCDPSEIPTDLLAPPSQLVRAVDA